MAVAFPEHGVGMIFVVHVDHDGGVGDVDLHVFPVDAQVGGRAEHVLDDPLAPGTAFHEKLAGIQDEFHFVPDGEGRFIRTFHNVPFEMTDMSIVKNQNPVQRVEI